MAITIKNEEEIALMRKAGQMLARVHKELAKELREGMTTKDVDRLVEEMILSFGGYPNFKGYNGFPTAACVSVNDEIVHGIPSDKRYLKNGDIVSIDTGVLYKGYHSDAARTHAIGEISDEARKLIDVTEDSFFQAIKNVKPGNHIVDIGRVVQQIALKNGYSVVRTLTGHGIGRDLHEAPNVPNYRTLLKGARLRKGMTLAIEPMINMGNYDVALLDNQWTYATADGSLSSHYENTVAVTDNGCEILTLTLEEIEARLSAADQEEDKNKPKGDINEAIRLIPEEFQAAAPAQENPLEEKKAEESHEQEKDTKKNLKKGKNIKKNPYKKDPAAKKQMEEDPSEEKQKDKNKAEEKPVKEDLSEKKQAEEKPAKEDLSDKKQEGEKPAKEKAVKKKQEKEKPAKEAMAEGKQEEDPEEDPALAARRRREALFEDD